MASPMPLFMALPAYHERVVGHRRFTMSSLIITVRAAIGIWIGTSIEDLVVLTTLFLSFRANGRPRPWQIAAGWYTGIACLVAIAGAAAIGLILVPENWVGLLGFIPVGIGVYKLIGTIRSRKDDVKIQQVMAARVFSIAAIAISNGGDNVSVYVPVFRTIGLSQSAVMVAVFAVCVGVWCAVAALLGSHKKLVLLIERYGHWIVPAVCIAIGLLIIIDTGLFTHLA
jgi:cadmium resistance protein CadD (predicted permease)